MPRIEIWDDHDDDQDEALVLPTSLTAEQVAEALRVLSGWVIDQDLRVRLDGRPIRVPGGEPEEDRVEPAEAAPLPTHRLSLLVDFNRQLDTREVLLDLPCTTEQFPPNGLLNGQLLLLTDGQVEVPAQAVWLARLNVWAARCDWSRSENIRKDDESEQSGHPAGTG